MRVSYFDCEYECASGTSTTVDFTWHSLAETLYGAAYFNSDTTAFRHV